jgi:hypothetical protein
MKTNILHSLIVAIFVFGFCETAIAQRIITYGPLNSNVKMEVAYQWSGCKYIYPAYDNCCPCNIGKIANDSAQAVLLEYSLPLNVMPYGSVIKFATVEFYYTPASWPDLEASFF